MVGSIVSNIEEIPSLPVAGTDPNQIIEHIIRTTQLVTTEVAANVRAKPDMFPDSVGLDVWRIVAALNPNVGGVHFNSLAASRRSPWEPFRRFEAELVAWFADHFNAPRNEVFGYVTTGSSEGNLMGLWAARNSLHRPNTEIKIALLVARNVHHSVHKSADILGFVPNPDWKKQALGSILIDLDTEFRMSVSALDATIQNLQAVGVNRFVIVASAGTTALGAMDPISEISSLITERQINGSAEFRLHIDAAIGGTIVPWMPEPICDITNFMKTNNISSITTDAHKLGGLPYNAGIFLARKSLLYGVSRDAHYTASQVDETVSGSRSGAISAALWSVMKSKGKTGLMATALKVMNKTQALRNMLLECPHFEVVGGVDLNVVGVKLKCKNRSTSHLHSILLESGIFPDILRRNEHEAPTRVYPFFAMPDTNLDRVENFLSSLN